MFKEKFFTNQKQIRFSPKKKVIIKQFLIFFPFDIIINDKYACSNPAGNYFVRQGVICQWHVTVLEAAVLHYVESALARLDGKRPGRDDVVN